MAVASHPRRSPSIVEAIEEITRIYKSLPPKPTVEEFEVAISMLKTIGIEENLKLEQIPDLESPDDLPYDIISLLQAVKMAMALFHGYQKNEEGIRLIEAEETFQRMDELIQKAACVVSGNTQMEKVENWGDTVVEKKMAEDEELESNSLTHESAGRGCKGKMSLMKVAALFESYAKTGVYVLDLQEKLMDEVEWLPLSLVKLSNLTEMNLSNNEIMALPSTMGDLKALKKLCIRSNQLINLPGSIGELINLNELDLHSNRLKSLPASFEKLVGLINLDLSSNLFTQFPDPIGNLSSLEQLNIEKNGLEELPCAIGSCTSLVELRLDFNRLNALPEEIGDLENLETLTVCYNRVKNLPTTMGNLQSLEELNLSFNDLESIPECLCSIMSLRKLNIGNNFVDLTSLPNSIGNLEMLEELDISYDQIRVLPDSFRFLSRLRVFLADETPLEIPPVEITKMGAQVVVQYMAEAVDKRHRFSNQIIKKS